MDKMIILLATALFSGSAAAAPPRFEAWMNGTQAGEPPLQMQSIDPDTFVIRQSFIESANAPFVYLLFGTEKALLLDTGDAKWPIREAVDYLISDWLARNDRSLVIGDCP